MGFAVEVIPGSSVKLNGGVAVNRVFESLDADFLLNLPAYLAIFSLFVHNKHTVIDAF